MDDTMTEMEKKEGFVMPGDLLGTEEEFAPSYNTFAENGNIYAAACGKAVVSNGRVSVENEAKEVRKLKRDMYVTGMVVGDVGAVMFVKIDEINTGKKRYVAVKDGKILAGRPSRGPPFRGGRDRDGGRGGGFGHGRDGDSEHSDIKQCALGDVVLARIIMEDADTFMLSLSGKEAGVIYSSCDLCGGSMRYDENRRALVCNECNHKEEKKVSSLYNQPNEIKKLLS